MYNKGTDYATKSGFLVTRPIFSPWSVFHSNSVNTGNILHSAVTSLSHLSLHCLSVTKWATALQKQIQILYYSQHEIVLIVWFDSLRPINNLSVIKGRVFLGWTSTKLGLIFLLKDTTQWRRWGSNLRPFGLESSALPLSHCAPSMKL